MRLLTIFLLLCASGWGAIAQAGQGCAGTATTGSSISAASGGSLTAGASLFIMVTMNSSANSVSTITTSKSDTGLVSLGAINGGTGRTELLEFPSVVGGTTSCTVTLASTTTGASCESWTYTGVAAVGHVVTNTATPGASLTLTLTTQDANNWNVGFFGSAGSATWSTSPTTGTFRVRNGVTGAMESIVDNTTASAGSSLSVTNTTTSANVQGIGVELRSTITPPASGCTNLISLMGVGCQ